MNEDKPLTSALLRGFLRPPRTGVGQRAGGVLRTRVALNDTTKGRVALLGGFLRHGRR